MKTGKIIMINGTSSSGKTSLVRALQGLMDEPYLEAGIDKFIFMLPERYLERPLWDDVLGLATRAGRTGETLVSGMHQAIAALARSGCNVLADHVLVVSEWPLECARLFAGLDAYLIGIQCPLVTLEARECLRRNRTLGQAAAQLPVIHTFCEYDLEVDTAQFSVETCAAQIKARVEAGHPQAFGRLLCRGE